MEDTELRERLQFIAARTAPPQQDPGDLAAAVVDRHRSARRRQWALAAVLAVVVAIVPAVRLLTSPESQPADSSSEAVDVYSGPTRGGLAGDETYVESVRSLPWAYPSGDGVPAPTVDDRHVVWANDLGYVRAALVAGPDPTAAPGDDLRAIGWFTGPANAGPDQMVLVAARYGVAPSSPAALVDFPSGVIIVVAGPSDEIQISARPVVAASGSVRRTFRPAPTTDGVASQVEYLPVVPADDREPVTSLRYRVLRDGTRLTGPVDIHVDPDLRAAPDLSVDRLRAAPPAHPGDGAVAEELRELLVLTGLPPGRVSATVLWAGDLPTADGTVARATVSAVRLPSGAYYVSGVLGYADGRDSDRCGSELRAAGPVEELAVVLRCDPAPGSGVFNQQLIMIGPPATPTALFLDAQGRTVGAVPLTDGVAVEGMSELVATVEFVDGDLRPVDERPPMGRVDFGD